MIVLWTLAFLYVFWLAYVLVMAFYRAHLNKRLYGLAKWLAAPIVLIGIVMDVAAQYTLAVLVFRDLPKWGEHLVTDRLQRYLTQPGTWRYTKAKAICENLLDPFDPTGKHC
jgi:hypothetical protein